VPPTALLLSHGMPLERRLPEPRYAIQTTRERTMPIILWLIGVPLSIVILLMLFGVIGF
jgi:hypothetical protein